jgi:Ser/Thr protein kinase RdoA (MazF antagonist)
MSRAAEPALGATARCDYDASRLKTMLNTDTLDDHVRRHYGIHGNVEPVPRGRASNYTVSHQGARWLLKVFQPEYTQTRLEQAADFVSFVVSAGYPAQEFVRSRDGARVVMLGDRAAVLIPWIDGDTPEPNCCTPAMPITTL